VAGTLTEKEVGIGRGKEGVREAVREVETEAGITVMVVVAIIGRESGRPRPPVGTSIAIVADLTEMEAEEGIKVLSLKGKQVEKYTVGLFYHNPMKILVGPKLN
jgi:hypothetical protein